MKLLILLLATLFLFGVCANSSIIAAETNTPSPWKFGPPHAADGYVLVRLETATAGWSGSEIGGQIISATFQPIEFKYLGAGGGGGGGYPGHNPFATKPVETEIGKSFNIHLRMFPGNSIVPKSQQSIASLIESCASGIDPKQLKLNLILSIPAAEADAGKKEYDYSHWFVESVYETTNAPVGTVAASQAPDRPRRDWVADCVKDFAAIKPGMTRREVENRFSKDGGIQSVSPVRFVHRTCAYFKIDVEFSYQKNAADQNRAIESPDDPVTHVSKPYLELLYTD